jgi:hypothetical protein
VGKGGSLFDPGAATPTVAVADGPYREVPGGQPGCLAVARWPAAAASCHQARRSRATGHDTCRAGPGLLSHDPSAQQAGRRTRARTLPTRFPEEPIKKSARRRDKVKARRGIAFALDNDCVCSGRLHPLGQALETLAIPPAQAIVGQDLRQRPAPFGAIGDDPRPLVLEGDGCGRPTPCCVGRSRGRSSSRSAATGRVKPGGQGRSAPTLTSTDTSGSGPQPTP